jgi:hypothetical protein
MASPRKLYPTGLGAVNRRSGGRRELDLRKEFDEILYGGPNAIPHGKLVLMRRMQRDADGAKIPCPCKDSLTHEPDTEKDCPFCLGEGFFWDETSTITYDTYVGADGGMANRVIKLTPGTLRTDFKVFYFRYDTAITYDDKIVELLLDVEGSAVVPYKRKAVYKPQTIDERRADFGRLEFIAVYCREQDSIRLEP